MGFRIRNQLSGSLGVCSLIFAFPILCFAQTVQFSSVNGMEFGLIEFAGSHSGFLTMGTNGSVSLTGSGLFYEGNGVPGQITIVGNSGIVEIKCESGATMGGDTTLTISDIEVRAGSGGGPGTGSPCLGIGGGDAAAVVVDLGATPNARIYFGGKLNIPNNALSSGSYSSTSGGDPMTISAMFQ